MFKRSQASLNLALIAAATEGDVKKAARLIRQGADVHGGKDDSICWASRNNHCDMVRLLLKHGANPRAENYVAFSWAHANGNQEMVDLLAAAIFSPDYWRTRTKEELAQVAQGLSERVRGKLPATDPIFTLIENHSLMALQAIRNQAARANPAPTRPGSLKPL